MDLNPLHALKSLGKDLVAAPKRAAHMIAHPSDALHELPGFAKDVFMSPLNPASYVVRGVDALLPDQVTIAPKMPDYTKLDPAERAKAEARSPKDLTYPMPSIRGNTPGAVNEPVALAVSGSKEEILAAMKKAGWTLAENGSLKTTLKKDLAQIVKGLHLPSIGIDYNPQDTEISKAFLHGRPQDMAFNKNDDHHFVRDHIRVWDSGKKDANGKPIWEIAATRDTGTVLHKNLVQGHHIDSAIDKERDMLMADLLNAGTVKDWQVAQGVAPAEDAAVQAKKYQTDGKVFQVTLG